MARPMVLIADDEPLILSSLEGFLREKPWQVVTVSDGQAALSVLIEQRVDVAVLDLRMPKMGGFEVLERIQDQSIETDVIILTGFGTIQRAVQALQMGAQDFMVKPVKKAEFAARLTTFVDARQDNRHVLAERLDAFLDTHASDTDLTLGTLQAHFRISKSYVCRLFRGQNTTFTTRLAFYRIEKAKKFLDTTDEPIYRVAELCGFRSAQRLSEVFSRLTGVSPSRYRQLGRPSR